eukprot:2446437-Rhodomonas_salina.1
MSLLPEAAYWAPRDHGRITLTSSNSSSCTRFSSRLGSGGWDRNGRTGLGDAGRGGRRRRWSVEDDGKEEGGWKECKGAVTDLRARDGESKQGSSAELSLARSDLEIEPESGH